MDKYTFPSTPLADLDAMVSGPNYRFTLINDMVLRYEWSHDGVFEDRASTFAINRRFPRPNFSVVETDQQLEIVSPAFHLFYDKKRFSPNGLHSSFGAKVTLWGSEWRYGIPDEHNLGGTARTLDEVDGRCDIGTGVLSKTGYSSMNDSNSMLFDGSGFVAPRRPGDRIDGYLFCYGRDFKGAMKSFYDISGRQPRLPRWALGNWWSRFHRYSAKGYLLLMDRFKAYGIPLSVAVIDMDWHLVNNERVPHAGWTGYTWDRALFPDPTAFGRALHERGLKMTLNDHPHSGIHSHEDDYEEMARALGHDTSSKLPILFDPTSPKFMRMWLDILHRSLERQGCDFWWIDWQQGPFSRIPGLDPLWLLNHFHFLDNDEQQRQKKDGQGLIFSRYAGPGSHRYPVGFSGDTITTWESLQFQPEFTATASNIGYGWWSHDVGGHMHGYRDDELAARWVQLGVFSPVLRLHSSNSPWASKEPWLFRPECAEVMRVSMQLRHRLVPYIYSTVNVLCDEPLVQPMYWAFPARGEAYEYPNQYCFGSSLVVAPVVSPRDKRTNRARVKVWVPPGGRRYVDVFTGCVYDGDRELEMYRTLSGIPVLAPEGAVIPLDGEPIPANGCRNPDALEVLVVVGHDGRFRIVEDLSDDGNPTSGHALPDPATQTGARDRFIDIEFDQTSGQLKVDDTVGKQWTFRFVSLLHPPHGLKILVDGVEESETVIVVESQPQPSSALPPGLIVKLPARGKKSIITVDLGADPQLTRSDHHDTMSAMLLDLQAEFDMKDKIWAAVATGTQPTGVRIGKLLGLGLPEAVTGPLLELMTADSRAKAVKAMVNGTK